MILLPGTARCPACGKLVYLTDDLFPVRSRVGGPAGVRDGFYHYRCFRAAPFRDAHLALVRPSLEAGLGPPDDRTALGRTADFAITRETLVPEYRLHALAHGRWFALTRSELARVLSGLTTGMNNERVRVEPAEGGASLWVASAVPVQVTFAERDFARLRPLLPKLGPHPASERVNLPELCERLKVAPASLTCPLAAAVGRVLRTEEEADGEFTLLATRWQELDVTAEQFEQLRHLSEQVLLAL